MRTATILPAALGCCVGLLAATSFAADEAPPKPKVLRIWLKALPTGDLRELSLNGKVLEAPRDGKRSVFDVLNERVAALALDADGKLREDLPEAVIDADESLRYELIIDTIQAVSTYRAKPDDKPQALLKRVRFAPR